MTRSHDVVYFRVDTVERHDKLFEITEKYMLFHLFSNKINSKRDIMSSRVCFPACEKDQIIPSEILV